MKAENRVSEEKNTGLKTGYRIGAALALILLLLAGMAGSGCVAYETERGSGNVVKESRSVEPFHSVDLRGTGNVFIEQSGTTGLEIEAEDNILPLLETSVSNGVLTIRPVSLINPTKPINLYITMDEVRGLSVSGSGDIKGSTPIEAEALEVGIAGSGDIVLEVNASSVRSRIEGSGDLLLKGRAARHEVEISGSGNVKASELSTESTIVEISGSGNAGVLAEQLLDIDISGSGSVIYSGSPEEFRTEVSGSGKVERID
ncbi:MAG: DUF2807 domain-containing protein [Methanosarcinaceae archaeon]|nr:DUF2807 domain-containing protein [Methanosarcinaceae archaeon]